jgi:hypothetical protein
MVPRSLPLTAKVNRSPVNTNTALVLLDGLEANVAAEPLFTRYVDLREFRGIPRCSCNKIES